MARVKQRRCLRFWRCSTCAGCIVTLDAAECPRLRSVAEEEGTRYVGETASVENRVHWVLDVTFSEDASRVRLGHGAANLGTVRCLSLNALRLETSRKGILPTKRLLTACNYENREAVVAGVWSMR